MKTATPKRVEIPGSQLLKLTSQIIEQEYDLYIHLPRDYQDTTKAFPVLYLLDAQWDFPLVTAIFGEQYYDGFLPGLIIVGVTWGGENPNYDALRARDLSPTNIAPMPQSGNAPRFLAFMKKELIPFIESKYRTAKDDRTLMGSSLGGLFTLYALFSETGLFNRYVLTSPAVGWDNEVIYQYEKRYAEKHSELPVRLFMAIGQLEGTSGFHKFVSQLKARNYKDLDLETRVLEGIGHSGSKAEGFTRGLQAVFARPSLILDPAVFQRYVGVYQPNAGYNLEIAQENGHLFAHTPDGTRMKLHAETANDFYVKGQYLFIHFDPKDSGLVDGFRMERFSGDEFVKRIGQDH